MSYYKTFGNYSCQTAFTSNTKFLGMCNSIYNKKVDNTDESNEEDVTPVPDTTATPVPDTTATPVPETNTCTPADQNKCKVCSMP